MDNLTPKRRAILAFIRERITEHSQPPSLADIAERFGFASRSVARKHITALTQAGYIDVTPNQARGIRRTPDYLLKVRGDSMVDDGIFDGDLVGIRQQGEAREGQIVVARLDGEVTIKRLQRSGAGYRLLPRNPNYQPIDVGPEREFFIEGVFCGLLRRD